MMGGPIGELAGHPAVVMALTVAIFVGAQRAQRRWPNIPLFNPTLVGVVVVIAYVECSGISYEHYLLNTQVLSFMLAPTVVLLAVPLYRRLALIRGSWEIIGCSLLVGLPMGVLSALGIALAWGARDDTLYSLAAKSVTTGIAVGISSSIGGIPVLTAAFVIITGIFGAAFGPFLLRLLGVSDDRAVGLAMGIGGHGIGTARAFQISDEAGAFSSLAMALNGLASAIVIPSVSSVFHFSREVTAPAAQLRVGLAPQIKAAFPIPLVSSPGRAVIVVALLCAGLAVAVLCKQHLRFRMRVPTRADAPE